MPVVAVLLRARAAVDDQLPDEIHVESPEDAALRRSREAAEAYQAGKDCSGRRWSTPAPVDRGPYAAAPSLRRRS
jgi:hypothetical protein